MNKAIKIDVTFPSGQTRTFKSVRAVARMLSGNGTASGGLRYHIAETAFWTGTVRNNFVSEQAQILEIKLPA
jgi:hypothetical protein